MKNFYRVMLGKKSIHAADGFEGGFIGADFKIAVDLSTKLPDDWRSFNKDFIPIFLKVQPDKTKIGAGLACGFLWTVAKGIRKGDIVLCPDGKGFYRVGEVVGDYTYAKGQMLPHRRAVKWFSDPIDRQDMSESLRASTGSIGTVSTITKHAQEIQGLLGGATPVLTTDGTGDDPGIFALEKHLEDFLVKNWSKTEIGKQFDIFEMDGEQVGQQYQTDTGPMDILAIRKDKKELLVVELKKGRPSDAVVGQILRYMGYAQQELAEKDQKVRGVIIAHEEDSKITWALKAIPSVEFYRYEINFKLLKG